MKLRSNWSLEETVEAFTKARPKALDVVQTGTNTATALKRKQKEEESGPDGISEPKRLRMSARLSKSRQHTRGYDSSEPLSDEVVIDATDGSDDEMEYDGATTENDHSPYKSHGSKTTSANAADSLVPCPLCQRKMKAWQVFQHLESCSGPTSTLHKTDEPTGSSVLLQAQTRHKEKAIGRLPAVNYSMLKEQALRKKLSEAGISSQGPRNLLERRHKEWITLWNANCDSAQPKKRSQLLQDLDVWEKTQGTRVMTGSKGAQIAAAIKDKDFDGVAWAAKHESSFKDLIASARKSSSEANKTKPAEQRSEPPDIGSIVTNTDDALPEDLSTVLGVSRVDSTAGTASPPVSLYTNTAVSAEPSNPDFAKHSQKVT